MSAQAYVTDSPEFLVRLADRTLKVRGRSVQLPLREFEVALALVSHRGFLTRPVLGSLIWPDLPVRSSAAFAKVYVNRLRKRLGPDSDTVATLMGGYRLIVPFAVDAQN